MSVTWHCAEMPLLTLSISGEQGSAAVRVLCYKNKTTWTKYTSQQCCTSYFLFVKWSVNLSTASYVTNTTMFTGKARMQFSPRPLKSTFTPSSLTLCLAQWTRPLYLCCPDSSTCIRDFRTSMGVASPQARTPAKPPESSTTRKPVGEREEQWPPALHLKQLRLVFPRHFNSFQISCYKQF